MQHRITWIKLACPDRIITASGIQMSIEYSVTNPCFVMDELAEEYHPRGNACTDLFTAIAGNQVVTTAAD
ncbi:MAG: hypothetical protein ACKO2P_01845 [Planctomycetota bacterium]